MSFVVRAHLPFSHLRIKQLHLEGIARNTINDNDGNNSYILNCTYYLLTMLSAEKCYVIQFQNNYKRQKNWPPSFIQRNVTSEGWYSQQLLLQQEEKLVQVKEKAKVRRGLKAEKADTFQKRLMPYSC